MLRDLDNQKGSIYVDNTHHDLVLHVTYLIFLIWILYCSPLPNGLPWLSSYLASHIFSLFFSSCALTVVTPSFWPFVLFRTFIYFVYLLLISLSVLAVLWHIFMYGFLTFNLMFFKNATESTLKSPSLH